MHDCWMTCSEENSGTLGMWWEQTISAPPSSRAVLQAQGNVEDHEDAGRTTSKTEPNYRWLSAWELHRTEQHGVQRCRWLWPSTLRNEEEPVQSSPVHCWSQAPAFDRAKVLYILMLFCLNVNLLGCSFCKFWTYCRLNLLFATTTRLIPLATWFTSRSIVRA